MTEVLIIVRTILPDIDFVAQRMREQDRVEISLSSGSDPLTALMTGYKKSTECWTVLLHGDPVVIFGVRRSSIVTNNGVVWMLATDKIDEIPYQFVRESVRVLNKILASYNMVYNYVWEHNTRSIEWLKWLGFTIHEPVPYGVANENFRRFEKRGVTNV